MFKAIASVVSCVSLLLPQLLYAQDSAGGRPDEGDSWKYFYFQKDGVSDDEAREDIIECYGYAEGLVVSKAGSSPTYTSVPYGGSTGLSPAAAALAGGVGALAGAIIVGFMDAGDRRAMERTNLRKCFGFKGYGRFELTKEEHEALLDGDNEVVRARLIERATAQAPEAERLVP